MTNANIDAAEIADLSFAEIEALITHHSHGRDEVALWRIGNRLHALSCQANTRAALLVYDALASLATAMASGSDSEIENAEDQLDYVLGR